MEYFNFLGLPEVVQDLIVHEIVHNSVPNDRIQLARTCKYMNEAVKRAKPKKIVKKVTIIWSLQATTFRFDSKRLRSSPSPEFFTNICQILQQIQVEELIVTTLLMDIDEAQQYNLFYPLFEATKFVTKLNLHFYDYLHEFAELYNKLEHVELMDYSNSIEEFNDLLHYPSKMRLSFEEDYDSSVLENITRKTVNNPLSSLFLDNCIPVEDLQRFLQETKFKNGCEIYCRVQNSKGETICIFLTFIDDEQHFEIETFPNESLLIAANQKYDDKNKRILALTVVEKKNFDYNHDLFQNEEKEYVLEIVAENDRIKINFDESDAYVHYSHQMLESNFPRNDYSSAQERLGDINNVLGCKIATIKAEMLSETIENLENGRIRVPDMIME